MIRLLLERYGADRTVKNREGKTAEELCDPKVMEYVAMDGMHVVQ